MQEDKMLTIATGDYYHPLFEKIQRSKNKKLTENASFSKKCEIPLGYLASWREPEFTKTKNKTQQTSLTIQYK